MKRPSQVLLLSFTDVLSALMPVVMPELTSWWLRGVRGTPGTPPLGGVSVLTRERGRLPASRGWEVGGREGRTAGCSVPPQIFPTRPQCPQWATDQYPGTTPWGTLGGPCTTLTNPSPSTTTLRVSREKISARRSPPRHQDDRPDEEVAATARENLSQGWQSNISLGRGHFLLWSGSRLTWLLRMEPGNVLSEKHRHRI